MWVDKIEVCKPITILLEYLKKIGFKIIEEKVSDFHFHELYFKLEGKYIDDIEMIKIDDIKKVDKNSFICECNWSVVELEFLPLSKQKK